MKNGKKYTLWFTLFLYHNTNKSKICRVFGASKTNYISRKSDICEFSYSFLNTYVYTNTYHMCGQLIHSCTENPAKCKVN